MKMEDKLKLYGFNNLTKSLSFNIYDICYAKTPREQQDYIKYINEQYNSDRLTDILTKLTRMIGAKRSEKVDYNDPEKADQMVPDLFASTAFKRKKKESGAQGSEAPTEDSKQD